MQNNVNIPNMLVVNNNKKNIKSGFTLAEVLITLGIIGVVAAMTMPTLIQKHNERVTVTKVKKAYNVLNNAYQLAVAEHGNIMNWGLSQSELFNPDEEESDISAKARVRFFDILAPYLKVTSRCNDYKNSNKCEEWEIRFLHGEMFNAKGLKNHMKLADGLVLSGVSLGVSTECKPGPNSHCGDIMVDINGKELPNTAGKDVFNFRITNNAILPMGAEEQPSSQRAFIDFCDKDKTVRYNGWACTAWVIYNENLDYLKCSGLNWNGKKSCKDK